MRWYALLDGGDQEKRPLWGGDMIRDLNVELNKSCERRGEGAGRTAFETEGAATAKDGGWIWGMRKEQALCSQDHTEESGLNESKMNWVPRSEQDPDLPGPWSWWKDRMQCPWSRVMMWVCFTFFKKSPSPQRKWNESVLERIDFLSALERFEVCAIPAMRKRKLIPL